MKFKNYVKSDFNDFRFHVSYNKFRITVEYSDKKLFTYAYGNILKNFTQIINSEINTIKIFPTRDACLVSSHEFITKEELKTLITETYD